MVPVARRLAVEPGAGRRLRREDAVDRIEDRRQRAEGDAEVDGAEGASRRRDLGRDLAQHRLEHIGVGALKE
jgi:hypothetical protein